MLKWLKPAHGQFRIEYQNGHLNEPDFLAGTGAEKLISDPTGEARTDVAHYQQ